MSDAAEPFRDAVRAFKVAHTTSCIDANQRQQILDARKTAAARVAECFEASTGVKLNPEAVRCYVFRDVGELSITFFGVDDELVTRMTEFAVSHEGTMRFTRVIVTTKAGVEEQRDASLTF